MSKYMKIIISNVLSNVQYSTDMQTCPRSCIFTNILNCNYIKITVIKASTR